MAICKNCKTQTKDLLKKLSDKLIEFSKHSYLIVAEINRLLRSDLLETLVQIIPGNYDNDLRDLLIKATDKAMKLITGFDYINFNTKEGLQEFKFYFLKLKYHEQKAVLFKLNSLIISEMDEKKNYQNVYDLAAQVTYSINNI